MKILELYLTFNGQCEEALNFYRAALGGEIASLQRFGDTPGDTPPEHANRVMHAEFRSGDMYFMASDSMPGQPVSPGTNVTLSINLNDQAEQNAIFNSLAAGGQVTMPLQETFWGAEFGMLTDKFGVNWMLNRELDGK